MVVRFAGHIDCWSTGTGKQVQRSITGKTQKEVAQKLKAATSPIDSGTYTTPNRQTLGEWLEIWERDYLGGVKTFTALNYSQHIKNHIKPALGAVKLEALTAPAIQHFYNELGQPRGDRPGLSRLGGSPSIFASLTSSDIAEL